jgi:hypothetical protein
MAAGSAFDKEVRREAPRSDRARRHRPARLGPAATPTNKQLARQIKTLQKQVKALQAQVRTAQNVAAGAALYSACGLAVTVDAFQGTWATVDDVSNRASAPRTIYGPQTAVNDFTACSAFRVTRAPTQVPPNVSVFSALLAIFR